VPAVVLFVVWLLFRRALNMLLENSLAFARGEVFVPRSTRVREFDRVSAHLANASSRLHENARELYHRVRNTLSVVQSIANRTSRTAKDAAEFRELFAQRIQSLAMSHDLLLRSAWEPLELRSILENELAAHRDATHNILLEGPDIRFGTVHVEALALTFHELATNAVKHGALRTEGGSIRVVWRVHERLSYSRRYVEIRWQESGGPPIRELTRRGLGSDLLENIWRKLNGTLTCDFQPDGLRCVLTVPLEVLN
jgi:two-component sensor histidine kinase